MSESADTELVIHRGGCHCGRVRFEVEIPKAPRIERCNCSICEKSGYLHLIVPAARFRLLSGADALTEYRFHTVTARHLFCSVCGIKPFYVPRSHPDGYSVNARCLDGDPLAGAEVHGFDGRNWERAIDRLLEATGRRG
ncbi:MAG TPA: GFA family protein [Thermoanaerobaculia bacterium]|nr:GFA family protein [Thermoanaerobaculia bacterium]